MTIPTDDHGQPIAQGLHRKRLIGRSADELIGICKGVLADGMVSQQEAEFLLSWMQSNAGYIEDWPFNHLYARLAAALSDGHLDSDEERELLEILSGMASPVIGAQGEASSNELLCDKPVPAITIHGSGFVLTGKFVAGKRSDLEMAIIERGGKVFGNISRKSHYLVIGAHGSRDWLMSTHGTKILAAQQMKEKGHPLAVVAERHFIPLL